ncbi:MAG: hypothetical protein MJE68_15470 [Proteobacteria bacterium]|nr:hypothetical protein [Pseudomonadota bacterium]
MKDFDDPLWFDKDSFVPWLEHIKDNRRLHLIKDPSVEGDVNKKLQVSRKKIEAGLGVKIKKEPSPEPPTTTKRKPKPKKEPAKGSKKAKSTKEVPRASSSESEGEASVPSGTKSRPTIAGKSPRTFKDVPKGPTREGSDIDTSNSESDGQ